MVGVNGDTCISSCMLQVMISLVVADWMYSDIVCTLCELSINAHPSLYSCSCTL